MEAKSIYEQLTDQMIASIEDNANLEQDNARWVLIRRLLIS
jgi:hypothetical protein